MSLRRAITTTAGRPAWRHGALESPRPAWWTATAPINMPVPASPALDPDSAAIVTALAAGQHILNVIQYGVPIYHALPDTPRWTVVPANADEAGGDWGPNPFAGIEVPLDLSWTPQEVSADGQLVAIDGDYLYDFYNLDLSGPSPVCDWGGLADPTGTLVTDVTGGATATNFARAGGVIRLAELAAGVIEHALVFSTDMATPTTFRFPATKTDGANLRGSATTIAEGTRVQLDPSYDPDTDAALRVYERIVAHALQDYGAYCIDNGGAAVGISVERPHGALPPDTTSSAECTAVGILKDFAGLENVPWDRLRILASWDGA